MRKGFPIIGGVAGAVIGYVGLALIYGIASDNYLPFLLNPLMWHVYEPMYPMFIIVGTLIGFGIGAYIETKVRK